MICPSITQHALSAINLRTEKLEKDQANIFKNYLGGGFEGMAFGIYKTFSSFAANKIIMNYKVFYTILVIVGMNISSNAGTPGSTGIPEKFKAIDLANFDSTANPRDDFYQYVNGNWLKNNPIPPTEGSWGSFNELREKNINNLRTVLDEVSKDNSAIAGSNRQKIRDFYNTGMDSVKRDADGAAPLKELFKKVSDMKNTDDLVNMVAYLRSIGVAALLHFGVGQDDKNSTEMITNLNQGGLGLPDRDYYVNTDDASVKIQREYLDHVNKMMMLLGDDAEKAAKETEGIMRIETELAKSSRTRVEMRDPELNYNKKTVDELKALAPSFNWDIFLKSAGLSGIKDAILGQPDFYSKLNDLFQNTTMSDWKNYLRWNIINTFASDLSEPFVKEDFYFYETILSGTKEMKPQWKRCLNATDGAMGEALGQLYVEKFFTAESKKKVNTMVTNLIEAYKDRINILDWMSPETKKKAIEKLNIVMKKLAYPDKWRDYSSLEIMNDSYVQNVMRTRNFEYKRNINKLGKPVDRMEWQMTPPTVNAYYEPTLNEIVFPAGIMQTPFFNALADDAVNYGCMGAVIGHELTHGFDDQGSQYDAQGNLKNWWTEDDKAKFKAKTEVLAKQFDSFVAIEDVHVNGHLTLGENLADLGGLTIAYYAYQKACKEGTAKNQKIDGFTGEQRFFISWAQGWRSNMRPETLKKLVKTNPHSPPNFRVFGPLSNMKEFYQAFNVKKGDKMWRPENERAVIW